jgi:hypothetical protein
LYEEKLVHSGGREGVESRVRYEVDRYLVDIDCSSGVAAENSVKVRMMACKEK